MDEGLFVVLVGKEIFLITTASATKFYSLRCYFLVMMWMGMTDGMEVTEWGWNCQDNSLIPVMLDSNPATEALLKMIYCNCSTGYNSLRYSCSKQGLSCSQACGRYQDDNCGNMKEGIASDDEIEMCQSIYAT